MIRKGGILKGATLALFSFIISIVFGFLGYNFPIVVQGVAEIIITSLSIIFGLSLALVAMVSANIIVSSDKVPKDEVRQLIKRDITSDNLLILDRQKYAVLVFLAAIVSGILHLAVVDLFSVERPAKISAAIFLSLSSFSFSIACRLPFTIAAIARRNFYLG
jgi:hypothetical protein